VIPNQPASQPDKTPTALPLWVEPLGKVLANPGWVVLIEPADSSTPNASVGAAPCPSDPDVV